MRLRTIALATTTVLVVCAGCKKNEKTAAVVTMSLDRGASSEILVTIHATDPNGGLLPAGESPTVTVTGGSATGPVAVGAGTWTTTVTADAPDTEVGIHASIGGTKATKTALALSNVDAAWGQPERLDGLVNTPGWEDGANVSPDGQWLIVTSYVPVDLFSCIQDGGTDTTPSCMTVISPVTAPERPEMLGAERVHGTTFDPVCPDLGITSPAGPPFFPTAAYGFHRQPDGSFAEPFVIGFDADGCLGPYGMSFTGVPVGTNAGIVFANNDVVDTPDTLEDVWYAPIALGTKNILGVYRLVNGQLQVTGYTPTRLPPVLPTKQGNPAYGGGYLWWDDEDLSGGARDLFFAPVSGTLPALTAGSAQTVGVSSASAEEIQPSLDGRDLWWFGDAAISMATLTSGADPALAGSWSARKTILAPAPGGAHPILATGEPTVAHAGGSTELYFVYIERTANGFDANVGRVKHR